MIQKILCEFSEYSIYFFNIFSIPISPITIKDSAHCESTNNAWRLFLARLLILIKKGGLLQLKFGVGVNIYLWAR